MQVIVILIVGVLCVSSCPWLRPTQNVFWELVYSSMYMYVCTDYVLTKEAWKSTSHQSPINRAGYVWKKEFLVAGGNQKNDKIEHRSEYI